MTAQESCSYTLYFRYTPNGRKPAILLEELGLSYELRFIDIDKGEQHTEEFRALNPNGKIPVLVDNETDTIVFESGAILLYLAEKHGGYLPPTLPERTQVYQWLMIQMSAIGPIFGQHVHFTHYASESVPSALERFHKESLRLCGVLDAKLAQSQFIAGDYSIADIALFPWIAAYDYVGIPLAEFSHLQRWHDELEKRPAAAKGMALGKN